MLVNHAYWRSHGFFSAALTLGFQDLVMEDLPEMNADPSVRSVLVYSG